MQQAHVQRRLGFVEEAKQEIDNDCVYIYIYVLVRDENIFVFNLKIMGKTKLGKFGPSKLVNLDR